MPSSWSQEKYIAAYLYAAECLDSIPFPGSNLSYMAHVSLVSMEVMAALQAETGIDGDLAMQCALLHDVLEKGDKTFDDLCLKFGDDVARGVQALTKNPKLPESQQMDDSLDRIQKLSHAIWIVKMADRITNLLTPPPEWPKQKTKDYWYEADKIYQRLKPASEFLGKRLSVKIKAYQKYIN